LGGWTLAKPDESERILHRCTAKASMAKRYICRYTDGKTNGETWQTQGNDSTMGTVKPKNIDIL